MKLHTKRSAGLFVMVVSLMAALAAPAAAAKYQIAGDAFYETGPECPAPPDGYGDFTSYPPLVMTGSLEGCMYTKVVTSKDNGIPSGVYQERGLEIFVGTLNGGPVGTFDTTYKFSSKWDPEATGGSEVHGRCQHPITAGSGTGVFEGVTGRLDFKDEVSTGKFFYRGHLTLP